VADAAVSAMSHDAVRSERRTRLAGAAGIALIAALMMLPPVGHREVVTGDEARFVLLARDMLNRGTWFDARVREQRYRNKPPLYPWSIKVLSMPSGHVTEATATLPITLAAIGSVFFTAMLGQRLFGRRAGLWAGLVLATSYGIYEHSQMLLPDMIVVLFSMAALHAFWKSIVDPPAGRHLLVFYAMVALGVFSKGPMGLLPLLVAAVFLVTGEGLRGLRRLWTTSGLVVLLVLIAAWFVPYVAFGGHTFARRVVWDDWLSWYFGRTSPFKYFNVFLELARGFMPWTIVLALPLAFARRQWRDPAYRFVFVAAVVPLVVVLVSHNHRTRYLLPVYPAMALLVAWWADAHGGERSRAASVIAWLSLAGAMVGLGVLAFPWVQSPGDLAFADGLWWKAAMLLAGTAAMTAVAFIALRGARPTLLVLGLAAPMVVMLSVGVWFYNDWVNRSQDFRQFAALIERHAQGRPVGVIGGRFYAVDVYLGRSLSQVRGLSGFNEWVARPGRPVIVVNDREWRLLQGHVTPPVEVLETLRVRKQSMYVMRAASP
jgi:4-amino-4-deoxy-L-arabinose transferase-like glycosyltransferase